MKYSILGLALWTLLFFSCKNEGTERDHSLPDMHTSELSVDWAGVYKGVTPCADCMGIETVLELRKDKTYTLSMTYMGRPEVGPYIQKGAFNWDQTGAQISLATEGEPIKIKVGENK